jgi:hypothetical protein
MRRCGSCDGEIQDEFRFCPHCGTALRTKIVEYFSGHPEVGDGGLRVSLYLTQPRHVRFSIWRSERAEAAMSLDPQETQRLARFLLATKSGTRRRLPRVLSRR